MKSPKSILALLATILMALVPTAFCTTSDNMSDAGGPKTIIEASPMSITVDAGKDIQVSYAITSTTTVTLSGTPIPASDLRAGMVAVITLSNDGKTAAAIHASPAPRTTAKPPKDNATTVWIVH